MDRKTERIQKTLTEIQQSLAEEPWPILRHADFRQFFDRHRAVWKLPQSIGFNSFLKAVLELTDWQKYRVELPHRPETVYAPESVSTYAIAVSLKSNGYLSHYSALDLHELTDQSPKVIYVNSEQRPQPKPTGPLLQPAIDRAFRGKQRLSKNQAPLRNRTVCVLSGKSTNRLGVVDMNDRQGLSIPVTGLERTLIDATVRPSYCGGIAEVQEAFARAAEAVDVELMRHTLQSLDYRYPYEQAIGFYMERSAKYPEEAMRLFERDFQFDFYLTYGIREPDYSERWRLYHPTVL